MKDQTDERNIKKKKIETRNKQNKTGRKKHKHTHTRKHTNLQTTAYIYVDTLGGITSQRLECAAAESCLRNERGRCYEGVRVRRFPAT